MATVKATSDDSQLVLGWRVTPTLDPLYWLDGNAKAGSQPDDALFKVPASAMGTHTAIVAQSGSGKSVFLGRIVEEIILNTKANCLILDPNADFRKVGEVESASLWNKAAYDALERNGKLPHESGRDEFESVWSKVSIRVRSGLRAAGAKSEPLRIWWTSLSMEFLSEDVNPMLRSELYHCHVFVKAIGTLLNYKSLATDKSTNLIDEAQRILRLARGGLSRADLKSALEQEFNTTQILGNKATVEKAEPGGDWLFLGGRFVISRSAIGRAIERFIERALTVGEYVSQEIERFYFGKAREYQAAGILQVDTVAEPWSRSPHNRIEVIDLPTLPDRSTRLLAINSLLTTEWERARNSWSLALEQSLENDNRVPTFIVVDEAHNLIPNEPRTKAELALREQFRTIVSEGRKYGLFLILVSQRPDKLDPLVLSECENKAVMKLGSVSVLTVARQMLGLDDLPTKLLEKSLDFEIGRALLVGRWALEGPQIIYGAARRTVEGGRNLRSESWAIRPDSRRAKEVTRRATKVTKKSRKK